MAKRKFHQASGSILTGSVIQIGSMLLLLCLEALLVRNGTLGVKEMPLISVAVCLLSSLFGNAFGRKGEGKEKTRLFAALIPAAILLAVGIAATGGRFGKYLPLCAAGLLVPGVLFTAAGMNRHRKGRSRSWRRLRTTR